MEFGWVDDVTFLSRTYFFPLSLTVFTRIADGFRLLFFFASTVTIASLRPWKPRFEISSFKLLVAAVLLPRACKTRAVLSWGRY